MLDSAASLHDAPEPESELRERSSAGCRPCTRSRPVGCFPPSLAELTESMVTEDPRPAIALKDLLVPGGMEAVLAPMVAQDWGEDRRGLLSIWTHTYFYKLLVPAVLAALALRRRLPLGIGTTAVIVDAKGMPEAIRIADDGAPAETDCPFRGLEGLVWDHLAPLISALAPQAGLSPRVLWNNAGNIFEWFIQEMMRHPEVSAEVTAAGVSVVNARSWPTGEANPLFAPVRYVNDDNGEPVRWRRICCLRMLLDRLEPCSNCPNLYAKLAKRSRIAGGCHCDCG